MRRRYILLDFDGTVADSEIVAMPIAAKVLVEIAKKQGHYISEGYVNSLFGKTVGDMIKMLNNDYGILFEENLEQKIHIETVKALSLNTKETEGMSWFLKEIKNKGFTPVIVTSSALDRVYAALECSGLKEFFPDELIFSAVSSLDRPQPKPSSAIYTYTLDKLGIKTEDTHSYEDSVSGIKSAIGAGIQVVGYLGGSHLEGKRKEHGEKLINAGASTVINSWGEAIAFFHSPLIRSYVIKKPSFSVAP